MHLKTTLPVLAYSTVALIGTILNVVVLLYIVVRRLWRQWVSSHFIAHLMFTNLFAYFICVPVFAGSRYMQKSLIPVNHLPNTTMINSSYYCRLQVRLGTTQTGETSRSQAFATCTIWSVMNYMAACIAGVHLLTFARIHYDQLFGLRPSIICIVSWVIGFILGMHAACQSTHNHLHRSTMSDERRNSRVQQ